MSMRERSNRICRLLNNQNSRAAYIRAKLSVLVPSQIRALRMKSVNPPMPRQSDLARETGLHQSRISMFETPGAANVTLETLANIAAGLKVGLIVKFVPFSEMLHWENSYAQDTFDVSPRLAEDEAFLNPSAGKAADSDGMAAATSGLGADDFAFARKKGPASVSDMACSSTTVGEN
jgi:transcriptional regulator with XRE-family HTH domain